MFSRKKNNNKNYIVLNNTPKEFIEYCKAIQNGHYKDVICLIHNDGDCIEVLYCHTMRVIYYFHDNSYSVQRRLINGHLSNSIGGKFIEMPLTIDNLRCTSEYIYSYCHCYLGESFINEIRKNARI